MRSFVLRENIRRFQELLLEETDEQVRGTLNRLLADAQRELALLTAAEEGLDLRDPRVTNFFAAPKALALDFVEKFETSPTPLLLLDPRRGLHIVDANRPYALATMTNASTIAGERLFDVFPDNPDDPGADGVSNLFNSLAIAAKSGQPHAMPVQRYDVRDPHGHFVERYWRPLNTPIFDGSGAIVFLLHQVEDVTLRVGQKTSIDRVDHLQRAPSRPPPMMSQGSFLLP